MEGDKGAHAFPAPYDACFGVLLANEAGEGLEVVKPVPLVSNVAPARGDWIITLSAQVGSIDCDRGVALLQVLAENTQVRGGTRDSMESHHYHGRRTVVEGEPFVVGELIAVKRGKGRVLEGGCSYGAGWQLPCRQAGRTTGEHQRGQCHREQQKRGSNQHETL